MVDPKQPVIKEDSTTTAKNFDPKTQNTTPSLYPDVDFVNRTLP